MVTVYYFIIWLAAAPVQLGPFTSLEQCEAAIGNARYYYPEGATQFSVCWTVETARINQKMVPSK